MTALSRALNWFVAPSSPDASSRAAALAPDTRAACVAPSSPDASSRVAALAPDTRAAWRPPSTTADFASRAAGASGAAVAPPAAVVADGVVTSAAVLGRAGDVEPVAAALALALRRQSRAKAATVAVVGPAPPADAGGGSAAARRIVARLDAHGFEAHVRGRLVWARLDPSDQEIAAVARRVTLIAAPAVLAITAPRTLALDEALAEQDLLVVVTTEPGGPLAALASSGLPPVHVALVRPLPRGPRRALARAGVRAPRRLAREVER
jgi:hypothetical protein